MTATAPLYPTTVASTTGSTWTNTTNATGSTAATFATWTNATNGGTGNIQLSGYAAQTAVNGGVQPTTIDSVDVTVASNVASTTNISAETVQLYAVTTAIGSTTTLTRSVTSANVQTVNLSGANCPTWAQLVDLRTQVNGTHGANTTSSTLNIDYVGVVVNYTAFVPEGSLVVSGQALVRASFY